MTRVDFFEKKRFVVSVPKDFDRDAALIDTVFVFIARSLLVSVKRFLSDAQRDAIDLYFAAKILEAASEQLSYQFATQYVHDKLTAEVADYLSLYGLLERYALFEDVLVRELDFVGRKVATLPAAPAIRLDVDAYLEQLRRLTTRRPGEETDLVLERQYIRSGIVLAGRAEKIKLDVQPYVDYILQVLAPKDIDTIYVLSDSKKTSRLKELASGVSSGYRLVRTRSRKGLLLGQTGDVEVFEFRAHEAGVLSNGAALGHSVELVEPRGSGQALLGTVKFVSDDGWGFITLDEPSYLDDAYFSISESVNASGRLQQGSRVTCKVAETPRGWRARQMRVLKGESNDAVEGETKKVDQTARQISVGTSPFGRGLRQSKPTPHPMAKISGDLSVETVVTAFAELVSHGPLTLAELGKQLRIQIPGFDHRTLGFASLLLLAEAVALQDERIVVYRGPGNHPYVKRD